MELFKTDFEAIVYIFIIVILLIILNNLINFIFKRTKRISLKLKTVVSFILRIMSILLILYLIIEGFPSFKQINPEYQAILTGAISTAIAFATSGIFSNIVSGIILGIMKSFDEGDLVKINKDKGIVRSISLTRTVMETFDYILIEKSNTEVISSPIVNYTIKLGKRHDYNEFKSKLQAPIDRGLFEIEHSKIYNKEEYEEELKKAYEIFSKHKYTNVYLYTFRMDFPYRKFRIIIHEVENLCKEYKERKIFNLKPNFHIVNFNFKISVKFRIFAFNSEEIFNYQSQFTNDIYKIMYKYRN